MRTEIIDGKLCMIGRGEDTALAILKMIWPDGMHDRQVPLVKIIKSYIGEHGLASLSSRQEKETIDIFFQPTVKHPNMAVRVQNKKGPGRSLAESLQKELLERLKIMVVDLNEYECKELFREKLNYLSIFEVTDALRRARVKP